MDLAQAEKFGVLQSRNHSKDAPLLGELQMILESHDVVAGLHEIFLPQLHDGVRHASGLRIRQTDRAHGPEPQRIASAPGELFNG